VDKLRVALAAEADRLNGAIRAGTLRLDEQDVLLVDEAGMLDHQRYAPLPEAAVASGATLVQVGDDRQFSPVGPGGLWTVTHRQAEPAGRAVELREVHRAHEERGSRRGRPPRWTDRGNLRVGSKPGRDSQELWTARCASSKGPIASLQFKCAGLKSGESMSRGPADAVGRMAETGSGSGAGVTHSPPQHPPVPV
jgi:hypothetical protein